MKQACQDGFALPVTVLALVVVAGLISGGVFLATQENQIAITGKHSTVAFLAAERGLAHAIGNTPRQTYEAIGEGNVVELDIPPQLSGDLQTESTVRIRSLGNDLYFVESTGMVTGGGKHAGAAYRTGTMVRPLSASFNVESALKTLGSVEIGGTGFISGEDHEPTGWTCDAPLIDPKPGVVSSEESETSGDGDVAGEPPLKQDSTLTAAEFLQFGPIHYDDLAAAADYTLSGGNLMPSASTDDDGHCDKSDDNNFGATSGACEYHFPIVHVTGDVSFKGYGQGIMLVDGDFVAQGGGRFNGIVIVKGELEVGGGNGGVTGGILVYNNGDTANQYTVNGNGVALYSKCAVDRAIENAGALNRIYPISERSWVNLSATGSLTY